ncbi:MAG: MBL fold metallo-hydrolase [Verrucomicrobia bacterium]|nr:MBL fold metallo-hydrolase [Verrucomicrobiota bacterium]
MKKKLLLQGVLWTALTFAATAAEFDPPEVPVHPVLWETYDAFFPPEVLKVTEGVYVAKGTNRCNPTLIEGENGLIIVDPGESIYAGQAAKSAFDAHLDNIFDKKPVKAIIYTHHHDCHIHGASVFADSHTEIIGHEDLMPNLFDEWYNQLYPSRAEGGVKMAGILFQGNPDWYYGYVLAGPQILGPSGFLPPTRTVKDELKTVIAGIEIHLISAPAETRDIVLVWLPGKKVLIEIGIIYKAFPALVTMRGSGQRNPLEYLDSLKRCRSLNAEYLVALHGGDPITAGKENVRQFLTDFSDAIQFIHDQTVQCLNRGLTPGEMQDVIQLPPHLADRPYLQQTYGRLDWNIYHIARYYRGYYTGKVRDLFPQSDLSKAEMAAELAGGVAALAAKAQGALNTGKLEWALELADDVLLLEPENSGAFETKKAAMLALAANTMNSQARNMILSDYLLMTGQVMAPVGDPKVILATMDTNAVQLMPLSAVHRILAVNLNATESLDTDMVVGIQFIDIPKNSRTEPPYTTLHVRRGILEVAPPAPNRPLFVINTDTVTWKNLVLGKLLPEDAIASQQVLISGGAAESFLAFMALFD